MQNRTCSSYAERSRKCQRNGHESLQWIKMATGSVARIVTNAMRGGCLGHVLWRSAFQAHRPHLAYPGTAYPVTIASLCSATSSRFSAALGIVRTSSALHSLARKFQADRPQRNIFAHELHELTRRLCAKKNGDRVGRTNLH